MDGDEDPRKPVDEPLGGDPACWLHLVCPSCGVVLGEPSVQHRPECEEQERNFRP
jgi:hypothetical protein